MKNQLTLLHFDSAEDLFQSINSLHENGIAICEIYSAEPIPGIEIKLGIRRLKLGHVALKYGCLGSMALSSSVYYFFQLGANWKAQMLNALLLMITFLSASRLFSVRVPKLFTLKPGDKRYLMIVDTRLVPVNEAIAHLFQYTSAVGLSPAVKNIVIS